MRSLNLLVILIILSAAMDVRSQDKGFHFKRRLDDPAQEGWYSIPLPADMFQWMRRDLTDLRIFQFKGSDTVEVQYVLRVLQDEVQEVVVELPVFNKSKKDSKLFLTVELKKDQKVNRLDLEFEEANFNGFVQLEGSADLKEWFNVDSLQRILSIQKDDIDFKATTLNFPLSHYRYLRIRIQADKQLTFRSGSFKKREIKYGVFTAPPVHWSVTNNKQTKQTILEVTLNTVQPVSRVIIDEEHGMDFYRPLTVEALRDSTPTQKGWTYYYDPVYSGYITSLDDHRIDFPHSFAKKLKIIIDNADNPPLNLKGVSASGPLIELAAKMQPGENYLFYGNSSLSAPSYDVVHFRDKIPAELTALSMGQEENLVHPAAKTAPLFESKLWLWGIMGVIIGVLGYFTLTMMRAKE